MYNEYLYRQPTPQLTFVRSQRQAHLDFVEALYP